MKKINEKHTLTMLWTHCVNFPILTVMIWSGMLIYWANDEYSITFFGHTFVRFSPQWFYNLLHIPSRSAEGMALHFLFMWFFTLNGIFYVLHTIISGEWRELVPKKIPLKRPGWLYCITCTSAKQFLRKTSTMPPSALLILLSSLWGWVQLLQGWLSINRFSFTGSHGSAEGTILQGSFILL